MEMLEAARREYHEDEVQSTALEVLQSGNPYLQDLVDSFSKKMRGRENKTRIACFFELKSSNVGRIVGGQDRKVSGGGRYMIYEVDLAQRFIVSESSGCLDLSGATSKYSLSRTHFDMNKFAKATEEDFEMVADVVKEMIDIAMHISFTRQGTLNTKRRFPPSFQAGDNKRARQDICYTCKGFGHQSKYCPEVCYGCGKLGHWRLDCPGRAVDDECYTCGEIGHWSEDCSSGRYTYRSRDEQSEDSEIDDENDMDDGSESENEFGEY